MTEKPDPPDVGGGFHMTQREFASLGGHARAKKLTKTRLSQIGQQGGLASGKARKKKKKNGR